MYDYIPHLEEIKIIRKLEQHVEAKDNISVFDVSHWNSGKEYQDLILKQYTGNSVQDYLDYHYSYQYNADTKQQVLARLLNGTTDSNGVFIPCATSAICCICDYLKKKKYKKICVLQPAYFSIYACLSSFGLNACIESVALDSNGNAQIPFSKILSKAYDAVWITSPIFSTGIYYPVYQHNVILKLAQKGIFVIIDESAASPKRLVTGHLWSSSNIISIFSPHKYLSINSTKFAIIVCSQQICDYLEDWIDVFVGSLPESSCRAIRHFLSPNFQECLDIHEKYIQGSYEAIQELCRAYPDNFTFGDPSTYITIQNKRVPYIDSIDEKRILDIMRKVHISFVPGYINGFSKQWGFSYRVNLTLNTHMLKSHLGRLFNYWED